MTSWIETRITSPTRLADAAAEGERVGPVNADGAVNLLVREGGAAVLSERNNSHQCQPHSESLPPSARPPDELVDRLPVVLPGLPVRPPLLVVVHQPLEAGVKLGSRLPQQQES